MPTVIGSLELNDDQVGFFIDAQEVNPAFTVLPMPKLLSNNQDVRRDNVDLIAEQALEVCTFL